MFYMTPSEDNKEARSLYEKNIFSVTRQLRYSQDAAKLALDLCLFINGLPVMTMELKNQLTRQNTENACPTWSLTSPTIRRARPM